MRGRGFSCIGPQAGPQSGSRGQHEKEACNGVLQQRLHCPESFPEKDCQETLKNGALLRGRVGAYSEVFCFQRHLHFCTLAVWWVALFHRTRPTLNVPESSWIKGVIPFSVKLSLLPALSAPDAAPHGAQQDSCNQDEHSHSTPEKRFTRVSFPQRIP